MLSTTLSKNVVTSVVTCVVKWYVPDTTYIQQHNIHCFSQHGNNNKKQQCNRMDFLFAFHNVNNTCR